jgi:hypothetical protein
MKTWVYGEYLVQAKTRREAVQRFLEKFGLVISTKVIKRGSSLW